ncbi:MAG: GyrI-like domain-containing protein [Actinomycetota bacterium]|nr:GyrI-like domain-containing protein [Actinomycetota bacterium]
MGPDRLRDALRGGDLRSIGRSNEVVRWVLRDPELFGQLIEGMLDDDPLVRSRCADAAEKVTAKRPDLLAPHRKLLLDRISGVGQPEVRWHVALMLPRLRLSERGVDQAMVVLRAFLDDESRLVRVASMQATADLAIAHPRLRRSVRALLERLTEEGTPAMRARGRKLLARLDRVDLPRHVPDRRPTSTTWQDHVGMIRRVEKADLTKQYKSYYTASARASLATFDDEGVYVALDGSGEPAGPEFSDAVAVLYAVAFALKAECKRCSKDFAVPKLEGLWWVDGERPATAVPRAEWRWRLMIRLPRFADAAMVESAKKAVAQKKGIARAGDVAFIALCEGRCVQVMHLGPYADESTTITAMHDFMASNGLRSRGMHHEIYLSDPRRTAPEKMKTILRQPVE